MTDSLPAPPRYHQDGWTPDVQAVFLETLMTTGSVREAAYVVGKTPASAYRLRAHPGATAFKAEWLAAVAICVERVRETAIDRAFNGRVMPVMKDGVEIGEKLVFNDRLLIQLMRLYDAPAYHAERAAAAQAALVPAARQLTRDEMEVKLLEALDAIDRKAAECEAEEAAFALTDGTSARGSEGGCETLPIADSERDRAAEDARRARHGWTPGPVGETLKAGYLRNYCRVAAPPEPAATHDDSVAKESPKAGQAHLQGADGGPGATRSTADLAGSGWFPHPGGASVISVSETAPDNSGAHDYSVSSDTPPLSLKAGLRTGWRQSG